MGGEAYGKKWGFLAIWVQWIESTIWYPTVLTFGAVSIAFIGMNDAHDMTLASNKMYTLAVVLIIYWLATFISLKGLSWVGKVAKVGGIVGTILPAALLIILGIVYLSMGGIQTWTSMVISSLISLSSTTWCWPPVSSCFMQVWRWAVST